MARIVAVDDEPDILDVIKQSLSSHEVFTASNGEAGLALARTERPGLIILDVSMPVMDGLAACRIAKNDPELKGIPILLLTGQGKMGDVELGEKAGADDYIIKPFSPRILAGRVEQILERPKPKT